MVKTREILEILQSQQYKCALTGVLLEPVTAALDHKVSRTKGGDDEKDNLHVIHETVNRMKHTLSVEEFIDWCKLVVTHAS